MGHVLSMANAKQPCSIRARSSGRAVRAARAAGLPLQGRLRLAIVQAVLDGRLAPGAPLPSSRELARLLGLSRNTVTSAYLQLIDEDFLESRPRSGVYVARAMPRLPARVAFDDRTGGARRRRRAALGDARAPLARRPADARQARPVASLSVSVRLRHGTTRSCSRPRTFANAARAACRALQVPQLDTRLRDRRRAGADRADPPAPAAAARRVRGEGADPRHHRRAARLLPAGRGAVRRVDAGRARGARSSARAQQLLAAHAPLRQRAGRCRRARRRRHAAARLPLRHALAPEPDDGDARLERRHCLLEPPPSARRRRRSRTTTRPRTSTPARRCRR